MVRGSLFWRFGSVGGWWCWGHGGFGWFIFFSPHSCTCGFYLVGLYELLVSDMENELSYPSCVPSSPRMPKFVIGAVVP